MGRESDMPLNVTWRSRAARSIVLLCAMGSACGGGSAAPSAPGAPVPPLDPCAAVGLSSGAVVPIVNGVECAAVSSPVVRVAALFADGSAAVCSGTVIAPRAVLTAAHCVADGPERVLLLVGTDSQTFSTSFAGHPDYNPRQQFSLDVAVVRAEQDLGPAPVPLLVSRDGRVGESAIVTGWGTDQTTRGSGVLRAGRTTIDFVGDFYLTTRHGTTTSGTCFGDSGGPILLSQNGAWTVAGVASTASGTDPSCISPGINAYTSVRAASAQSFIRGLVPEAILR